MIYNLLERVMYLYIYLFCKEESLMKNLKKILAALLLVLAIGGLTACSQMNKVTANFEDQGYV